MMSDGERLKELLAIRGMTVKELARRTGIASTTIYSTLQRKASIRPDTAQIIAQELDADPRDICSNFGDRFKVQINARELPIHRAIDLYLNNDSFWLYEAEYLLLAYYQMDEEAREELDTFIALKLKRHTDLGRAKQVKEIIRNSFKG